MSAPTTLECAAAGCEICRRDVQAAHGLDGRGIRLHQPPRHGAPTKPTETQATPGPTRYHLGEVHSFRIGDRVMVVGSGWTGTITKKHANRNKGYCVRWDARTRTRNEFAPAESNMSPLNLRPNVALLCLTIACPNDRLPGKRFCGECS